MKKEIRALIFCIIASILVGCETEEEKYNRNANNSYSTPRISEEEPRYGDFMRQTREVDGNNTLIFNTYYVGYETKVEYFDYDRVRRTEKYYRERKIKIVDQKGGVTTTIWIDY